MRACQGRGARAALQAGLAPVSRGKPLTFTVDVQGDSGFWENGARGRSRTADTAIFSRMLYQLSYPGTG